MRRRLDLRLFSAFVLSLGVSMHAACAQQRFEAPVRWIEVPVTTPAGNAGLVLFGDVDGDRKADMGLYNQMTGEIYVARSSGKGFLAPVRFASGLPRYADRYFQADFADVNADGRADLVILSRGRDDVAGDATALVALSDGRSLAYPSQPTWNASWCASYQICLFGDLDGNGAADMAAFTQDFGTVWGSLSAGDRFAGNAIWNAFYCIRGERCALGDVDGDRRADAILFKPVAPEGQKGNVLVARSTGSAFVDVRYGHGFFCIDAEVCLVGDVNGDARSDIVLVKGFGGSGTFEALASLSNGTTFINTTPFTWATMGPMDAISGNAGAFLLADVTGDGRADLVRHGASSRPIGGGGFRTVGIVAEVLVSTERPPPAPTPSGAPAPSPQPGGFSRVNLYNCQTEQNRLHYWVFNNSTGDVKSTGAIDAMYSEWGTCPDLADAPQSFTLATGSIYTIVAVDPLAIGCDGRNDPTIVGCAYGSASFRGNMAGPACNWIVGASGVSCGVSIGTMSVPGLSTALPCRAGFFYRQANPRDFVCVSPATRDATEEENRLAVARRLDTVGPFGPATCKSGFVWRAAYEGDLTCVTPDSRDRAAADNLAAPTTVGP
jgi:hypothetical protein